MDWGFDAARPWVALIPEPSAPAPSTRLDALRRLSLQIRGLTVAQFPNAPLWLWLLASAVGSLTTGGVRDAAEIVALVGLLWWAAWEIWWGVNWFRRVLGVAVGVVTILGVVS